MSSLLQPDRRLFLKSCAFSAALFTTRGLFAEELVRTAAQTEGPFYPDKLPLDTDNDLLIINDATTPSLGTVAHFSGRVLDAKGEPVRNALVEIWQCDNNGVYLHSRSDNGGKRDKSFQGYGRFLTGRTGEYYFRTIKPVPYPGRTPHIHVKVTKGTRELLTTQCYVKGEPANDRDFLFRGLRTEEAKNSVLADFAAVKASRVGEVAATFDIVLGVTPAA